METSKKADLERRFPDWEEAREGEVRGCVSGQTSIAGLCLRHENHRKGPSPAIECGESDMPLNENFSVHQPSQRHDPLWLLRR